MATTIGKLNFMVAADASGVSTGLSKAGSAIQQFNSQVTSIAGRLAGVFGGVSIAGLTGWGVKLAADAEMAQVAFSTMLGSGRAATQMLRDLRTMGAETPFEFPELRDSARTLVAFGQAQGDVLNTLRMLGDISAGTGKNLGELTLIYGQVMAAGRLMTQDLNQLSNAGIPMLQALADHFGVTKQEVRKMVEQGAVDFQTFDRLLKQMTSNGGLYFNMTSKTSESLQGRWSTLKDTASELALNVGTALMPALKSLTEVGIGALEWVKNLDTSTLRTVVGITSMTAAFGAAVAIVPRIVTGAMSIVKALRAVAIGQSVATALSGPSGWIALAAGLAAAAGAGLAVNAMFDGIEQKAAAATKEAQSAASEVRKVAAVPPVTVTVHADTNAAMAHLQQMREEMQSLKDAAKAEIAGLQNQRGRFTAAVDRHTMAGFEAVARAGQESRIQQQIASRLDTLHNDLLRIEARERETKETVRTKEFVQVRETRI